ncbi:MAG: addiction module protein [Nitrososphaera sp.]|nr:addiction module protein [Nitrososphaera sp.]
MSVTLPLEKMSVAEKVQMMELIWDSLCREAGGIESPPWHQEILARREKALESGDDKLEDWNKAKMNILKQVP